MPFGIIVCFIGFIGGFTAHEECVAAQPGRALFLKIQLATFFFYILWFALPVVVFKLGDSMFKPNDADADGKLMYETWT